MAITATTRRHQVRLVPQGPFSLAASTRFLEGFAPAGHQGRDHLHLAFAVEGDWRPVGVCLQEEDGEVRADVYGDADEEAVARQVTRILSLDVDGRGWPAVGTRDPVVGRLQARYPGLRPVTFWSSYEAAAWAVLSHRIRITQAAVLKRRLTERAGTTVDVHGDEVLAFPAPAPLLAFLEVRPQVAGLTARKADHLAGVAVAALEGRLDSAALRAQPREAALAALQELPGIGPFSADLVLLRGAGDPDAFPHTERRLHATMADLYGLTDPGAGELAAVAERWRPYRTWAGLLLRVWREDTTGEIGGRPARIRQTGDRD